MILPSKVAVITGAGSGIGQAIATRFCAEGARVVIADSNETKAEKTRLLLRGKGYEAFAMRTDVSDPTSVVNLFDTLDHRGWAIDILVNNAGNLVEYKRVHEMDDALWTSCVSVHLNGTFYCTRESLKRMIPRKRGIIINMSSVAGIKGLEGRASYAAAKGGIIAFTKGAALEVSSAGIRVNCIAPGFIDTPLLSHLTDEDRNSIAKMTPLGRLGTPEEIAAVAVFLASDESSYVVGQVVSPNGGLCL